MTSVGIVDPLHDLYCGSSALGDEIETSYVTRDSSASCSSSSTAIREDPHIEDLFNLDHVSGYNTQPRKLMQFVLQTHPKPKEDLYEMYMLQEYAKKLPKKKPKRTTAKPPKVQSKKVISSSSSKSLSLESKLLDCLDVLCHSSSHSTDSSDCPVFMERAKSKEDILLGLSNLFNTESVTVKQLRNTLCNLGEHPISTNEFTTLIAMLGGPRNDDDQVDMKRFLSLAFDGVAKEGAVGKQKRGAKTKQSVGSTNSHSSTYSIGNIVAVPVGHSTPSSPQTGKSSSFKTDRRATRKKSRSPGRSYRRAVSSPKYTYESVSCYTYYTVAYYTESLSLSSNKRSPGRLKQHGKQSLNDSTNVKRRSKRCCTKPETRHKRHANTLCGNHTRAYSTDTNATHLLECQRGVNIRAAKRFYSSEDEAPTVTLGAVHLYDKIPNVYKAPRRPSSSLSSKSSEQQHCKYAPAGPKSKRSTRRTRHRGSRSPHRRGHGQDSNRSYGSGLGLNKRRGQHTTVRG